MLARIIYTFLFIVLNIHSYGQERNSSLSKPNILFIMVDDLRPELGCYDQSHIISPNIDRLAKMGQLFTQAYVNYPVCGPSRATLLSGLYGSRSRFNGWNCSQDDDVPGIVSMPMHFRNNDYRTVSLGKVYNNFDDGKGSWDEIWRAAITTTDWDYQTERGIAIFEERNAERYQNTSPRNNNNLPKRSVAFEKADVSDVTYMDGRIATRAIEKLQEFQLSSQPFFMAVRFHKPHLPFNAPEKYWNLYDSTKIKLPENYYQPDGAPEASMHNFGELRAYYGIPDKGPVPENLAKKLIHGYYACVSYVDAQIGKVVDALESLGLEKNTIIVLWGDHGWQLGEHALWCKHANFRTSLRIPVIFKVPGKKSGILQDGLIESVDIFPTLCELSGLSKPFHLQGRSFASTLDDPTMQGKQAVFSRSNLGGETIITDAYSYTEFFDNKGAFKARMLYDLQADNEENTNIGENPKNQQLINTLSEKLNQHIAERDKIPLK